MVLLVITTTIVEVAEIGCELLGFGLRAKLGLKCQFVSCGSLHANKSHPAGEPELSDSGIWQITKSYIIAPQSDFLLP